MKHLLLSLTMSSFIIPFSAHAKNFETPIRSGLGFEKRAAAQFNDENILSAIQYAFKNTHVHPVIKIKLNSSSEKLSVLVIGEGEGQAEQFTFKLTTPQLLLEKGPLTDTILQQVEIPLGNLQAYGIQSSNGMGYSEAAAWIAVGVVGLYATKKLLNKITTGKFSAGGDHAHESIFPTPERMRTEMLADRNAMELALAKAEEALDGQLLDIVKPLAQTAACGSDHGAHADHDHQGHSHGLSHAHGPSRITCEGVSDTEIQAARLSLLRSFPQYAIRFGIDFYQELIAPIIDLAKAAKNKDTRKQIWNFFDLISRRMIKERGVGAAVATGVFVGAGQIVIETLESFVMPAGAHLFCQVGNAAVLAVAAKAYTTYFCMTQNKEFKDKSLIDRWRVAQDLARLSKVNAVVGSEEEKIIHALNLLFRWVERDVRHARNLEDLQKPESRELARRLGDLRRELTLLSIRMLNKTAEEGDTLQWLKNLNDVQSSLWGSGTCADDLVPAA